MRMSLGENLAAARGALNWSQTELSAASGVTVGNISAIEKRKSKKSDHQSALASALGLSIEELLASDFDAELVKRRAEERKFQNSSAEVAPSDSSTSPEPHGLPPVPPSKFKQVWAVGRGSGGQMPERMWTDGDYPVGATGEYAEIATTDPHAFLGEVVGPSMIPRYNPGEYFLVEPGTDPDIEDDVLVRLKDGQTLLKRLMSRRSGYRLGSYNSDETLFYTEDQVSWVYYVAHPVPRRRIKQRT